MFYSSLHYETGGQAKYRIACRVMIIHILITIILPRKTGLINARRRDQDKVPCVQHGANSDIIARGHSHNDYFQSNPLSSALNHGLRSVEVDVFPIGDTLYVAHTRLELDDKKTIETMYVQPILDLMNIKKNSNNTISKRPFPPAASKRFYSKAVLSQYKTKHLNSKNKVKVIDSYDGSLVLLVDLKADPNKSVKLLKKSIEPLQPYLSKVKNGIFYKGPITVLISGYRPKEHILYDGFVDDDRTEKTFETLRQTLSRSFNGYVNDDDESLVTRIRNILMTSVKPSCTLDSSYERNDRYLFIDGRIKDLHCEKSTSLLVPMISLNWGIVQIQRLLGRGDIFMKKYAELAHSQGKSLRIWGAPNTESAWRKMMRNDIDWLSIDDHARFAKFAAKG